MLVYIREAHPDSVLYTVQGKQETLVKISQTSTLEKRAEVAEMCLNTLKLSTPAVIDREDNKVNIAYAGWPDRMYVVGVDGRIAYRGGPGPGGFKVNEVEQWLKKHRKPLAPAGSRMKKLQEKLSQIAGELLFFKRKPGR